MIDLTVEEALARILAGCSPRDAITVESTAAAGLVLADPVLAPHDLPPFRNAAMDGFAVRAADIALASRAQPVTLPVVGEARAGNAIVPAVAPGAAVRIMTGALLPDSAEAVVPLEESNELPDERVAFFAPTQVGRHVRPAGEDVPAGAVAIPGGHLLRAAEIALLCALGIPAVPVVRRPRVAIISTGDELLQPDKPLTPGKIRDANGPALAAFVADCGAHPLPHGIARDTQAALRAKIEAALSDGADLLLTSAGASAGDYDTVRALLRDEDWLELWRVNLKPGRPLLYGQSGGVPLIGLPGNPASALIVAELFVRPAISRLRGLSAAPRPTVRALLDAPLQRGPRRHYLRARLEWENGSYRVISHSSGGGGALRTLVHANALLIIPEGSGELAAGSSVEALLL